MFLALSSFITLFLLASNEVVLANFHHYHHHVQDDKSVLVERLITVDQSGHGDFTKIQAAIDSVPSNNKNWISIKVNSGTYREKVMIPEDKPYVVLKGVGKRCTIVEWDDHDSSAQSPTFLSMADNIVVKAITFRNTYNDAKKGNPMTPALAGMITGDKTSFFQVGFYGLQDTLWDVKGRHYFNSCTIEGAMDFIFGAGRAVIGFITAQGRTDPEDSNGFVFKNCKIFGVGKTYLGRPWRDYARVLFYKTMMSSIVQPLGWQPWNSTSNVAKVTFAESDNFGLGSSLSGRVSWLKKLDPSNYHKHDKYTVRGHRRLDQRSSNLVN
ncbi:hypothetical protein ACSQ67_005519 [Phaseolus vulgaris]